MKRLLAVSVSIGMVAAFPTEYFSVWNTYEHEPQLRGLEIGKINFLHTTDTHGWLGSHLNQGDYDADWGDYVSFIENFRERTIGENRDLLVVDTGDKRDGNGISDASREVGYYSSQIFNEVDYDILTLGNHELYTPGGTELEYKKTALSPKFRDKYVSSNVEYVDANNKTFPFGNKFMYFTTKNTKTRILVLSFLFDFRRSNYKAIVTPALEELEKDWIKNLAKELENNIDMVVVAGHIPPTDPDNELNLVHQKLREYFPDVIIQYFGGHSHIRDFVRFDNKSTCLQSGKFAETLGFLSIDGLESENVKFFRRYIDFNKRSFSFHSKAKFLETKRGLKLSNKIRKVREKLGLDQIIGYVPKSYYLSARNFNADDNLYHLLTDKILPKLVGDVDETDVEGRLIIINTGSVRYDLHKGDFTRDTVYNVMPFPNNWKYLTLPYKVARLVKIVLNRGPAIFNLAPPEMRAQSNIRSTRKRFDCPFVEDPDLSEGLTTVDDDGCDGDNTPHRSQRQFHAPNVVQTRIDKNISGDSLVHLVFYEFMTGHVINAINDIMVELHGDKFQNYTNNDAKNYGGKPTITLLSEWAHKNMQG